MEKGKKAIPNLTKKFSMKSKILISYNFNCFYKNKSNSLVYHNFWFIDFMFSVFLKCSACKTFIIILHLVSAFIFWTFLSNVSRFIDWNFLVCSSCQIRIRNIIGPMDPPPCFYNVFKKLSKTSGTKMKDDFLAELMNLKSILVRKMNIWRENSNIE